MEIDVALPEVASLAQRARFFRSDERDMLEISAVGSEDTLIKKVSPEDMARFKTEWDAYCDGRPLSPRKGTALTESVSEERSKFYVQRNIHTLEELAALTDGQCQAIGHGVMTEREAARKLIALRKMEATEKARQAVSDASASIGPVPADKYASQTDLAEVKQQLSEVTNALGSLIAALNDKPKRGRPPKKEP